MSVDCNETTMMCDGEIRAMNVAYAVSEITERLLFSGRVFAVQGGAGISGSKLLACASG